MMLPTFNAQTLSQWQQNICVRNPELKPETSHSLASTKALVDWASENGISPDDQLRSLAESLGLPWLEEIAKFSPSRAFVSDYPISLARKHYLVGGTFAGTESNESVMPVVVGSLTAFAQLDHVRRKFRVNTQVSFAARDLVLETVNKAYQSRSSETEQAIGALDRDEALFGMQIRSGGEDLLETTGKSPVIKLTNSLIFDAIQLRASDIHIQPCEEHLQVRFRIDGLLFDQAQIPKENQEEILSRVKVMGKMNIAEKRLPQDGRASVSVGNRNIDLRIASLPTSYGERVVIRLLDKGARLYSLEELGMSPLILNRFRKLIHQEHGLFLVTGPTGGGKSTTLYAALQEMNVKERNVVTLEDPIEYQLQGISQTQINEKKGLTFARGLRNVLRQDPDIIMVGEIRDRETAEMAIQSALTGHMVYSTLHTNDATSAVTRLLDLGIEPFLVSSSVIGVLAQRLVRDICQACRVARVVNDAERQQFEQLGIATKKVFHGAGCSECRETGYQGRIGIFEMMTVTDSIQQLIQQRQNASELRKVASVEGMKALRVDGLEKVAAGSTTMEEIFRVSMELE